MKYLNQSNPWKQKIQLWLPRAMRMKDWRIVAQWVRASITQDGTFLQICCTAVCIYGRRQWHPTPVTLAWKIPWTEEPGRLQSMGSLESDTTERLHFHFSLSCIGEGNGNPLQCSCLENPRDGGACGLPSMGSHRVGDDWSDLAVAAAVCIYIPGGSAVKILSAMQEMQQTQVRSLGWEDNLEQEMATHSRTLAWRIPWTEDPGGYCPWVCRVRHDWAINTIATNFNVYIVSNSVPYTQKLLRR